MMPFHFTKSLALLRIVSLFILLVGSVVSTTQAQIVTYFHNDISGTPMAATNAIGNLLWKESYRPYGERLLYTANPTTNTLWFGGKSQDPTTGLSYLGARYYNPQLGRFMGIDPKEVDPEDLHSFNRYAYANNNPYKFVDPDGRFPIFVFAAALGRIVIQRIVTFALTRGAQASLMASEVAAGDALGGASLAAGATAGAKAIKGAEEAVAEKTTRTYHRLGDSLQTLEAIESSKQVWGRPPTNIFASDIPKVKAYDGPLPEGAIGFEFKTHVVPDRGQVPGQPTWSGPRQGVTVEGEWAKIPAEVTKETIRKTEN